MTVRGIESLLAQLRDSDPEIRAAAAQRLCRLGPEARSVAIPLVEACGDLSESVREWATAALEEIGPPEITGLTQITELLNHSNADVAYWAATLLGRLHGAAAPAVPRLGETLDRRDETHLRQRIVWALGEIGPPASTELRRLKELAEGPDPRLARLASRAVRHISADE